MFSWGKSFGNVFLKKSTKIKINFLSLVAGYFGGRLYRTLKGTQWKKISFATAIFYPFILFGVSFLMNFFIWGKKSSGAVPFSTMIALVALIFCISVPLVFVGYYFGYRKQVKIYS
jgi:transmembrane 9 superfamily protein 2/4